MVGDGLRQCLDSIVVLESRLEEALACLAHQTREFLEAPVVIGQLQSLVAGQRQAVELHVQELGGVPVPPLGATIAEAFDGYPAPTSGPQGPLAILGDVAAAFTRAAVGYGVLHALAHRAYDVATADLADQHRRRYLQAIETVHRAVGDVAVQELHEAGHPCRCQCPACGPGLCICWHIHTEPHVADEEQLAEGIVVRTPRVDSNAERAGLGRGDVILLVDDQAVGTYEDMREGLGSHQPGDEVRLRVRRLTDEVEDVIVRR